MAGAQKTPAPPSSRDSQVVKALSAVLHNQWRLATLEPGLHLAMLTLTLVTSSGSLPVARGGTATDSLLLVNSARVVGQAA